MSNKFSIRRRASLYSYIVILLSLYTVQVLANPILPTKVLQKRQAIITITSSTTATYLSTITKERVPTTETFLPSKPRNCDGLVKFSKVKLAVSKSSKTVSFIAEGNTKLDIDTATVKASIYWDGRSSIEYIDICPSELCQIGGDRPIITFNHTTPLPDEFLGNDHTSIRSAYMSLSVISANGNTVLGCVTVSFNGIFTDAIPYFFNVPIIFGTISAVFCILAAKSRSKKEPCEPCEPCEDSSFDKIKPTNSTSCHDPNGDMQKYINPTSPGVQGPDYSGNIPKHVNPTAPGVQGPDYSGNPTASGVSGPDYSGNIPKYVNPTASGVQGPDYSSNPTASGVSGPDYSGNIPKYVNPTASGVSGPDYGSYMPSPNEYPFPTGNPSHDPIGGIPAEKPVTHQPPSPATQAPSVYDIIRAAQFFVTTALISLPGLPHDYRDVASKLGWVMGLPASFDFSYLSKIADERIRKEICYMTNFCSSLTKSTITYNRDSECIQKVDLDLPTPLLNATGFTSYGKHLNVPDYNLFFIMIISFCYMVGVAIVIASLIWLFAWSCKHLWKSLWNKWSFLETATKNVHFLILGGILRLILFYYPITLFAVYQVALIYDCWLFILLAVISIAFFSLGAIIFCGYKILRADRSEFDKPPHTLFYGSLYTQYRDDTEQTCIWFFICTITYDFLRALIVGLGQRSAIAQITGLFLTELILSILTIYFKPFKTSLMNYLKICISVVQFVIVCLLIPFLSNTPLLYRIIIDYIMKSLQFILTILIVTFTIVTLIIIIRNFINRNKEEKK